jgi:hypothetical protein
MATNKTILEEFLRANTLEFKVLYKHKPEYKVEGDDRIITFTGETYRTEFYPIMHFNDYGMFIQNITEHQNPHTKIKYIIIDIN